MVVVVVVVVVVDGMNGRPATCLCGPVASMDATAHYPVLS
jgi:hypothetical protein